MSRAARAYANNQVHTAVQASSSGELIVLVYERIFDHLKVGKLALQNGQHGAESFTKAHDLIQQGLYACLDYKGGGDVAQSLGAIYEWALREIINARSTKSPEKIQEVLDVLTPLYEAWTALAPQELKTLQAVNQSNVATPKVASAY